MNNKMKQVLLRDAHRTYNMYGTYLLIFFACSVVPWLTSLIFRIGEFKTATVSPYTRYIFLMMIQWLAVCMAPARIYGDCNQKGKGIYFAMLPAKQSHKFLSMVCYCFIIIPLCVVIGTLLIDTLLYLIPIGAYREPIWNTNLYDIPALSHGYVHFYLMTILGTWCTMGAFFFGNTLFKKNKFILTCLSLLGISWLFGMLMIPITLSSNIGDLIDKMDWLLTPPRGIIVTYCGYILIIALLLYLSWRRLKRAEY